MSIFNQGKARRVNKNKFDLSHEVKMTNTFGELRPFYVQEVVPGDSFRVTAEIFARANPLVFPVMHRVDIKTEFFYVPYFQIWDEWKKFIRGGDSGTEVADFPTFSVTNTNKNKFDVGSLADFLGVPPPDQTLTLGTSEISALPFRAYQHIWNEWYRDQDLQSPVDIQREVSGNDPTPGSTLTSIRKRSYQKDYFTSARPNAQKGNPVNFLGYSSVSRWADAGGDPITPGAIVKVDANKNLYLDDTGLGRVEISVTNDGTVQELRRAEAMQSMMERLQRSGNRYREWLAGLWGEIADDMELDIPYYLGSGSQPIVMSEVLQTADFTDASGSTGAGVGELYGHGVSSGNHTFKGSFKYFGIVIGLVSIVPKASYSQGLHRMWKRFNRFDYYHIDLSLIGEEPIKRYEIYKDWANVDNDNDDWGYQQRYASYKYGHSRVAGAMRNPGYREWHLDRDFSILSPQSVNLNEQFIEIENSYNELGRIFQVPAETEYFMMQIYNKVDAIRPMEYEAIPDLT